LPVPVLTCQVTCRADRPVKTPLGVAGQNASFGIVACNVNIVRTSSPVGR
jgi:hypothetical protein